MNGIDGLAGSFATGGIAGLMYFWDLWRAVRGLGRVQRPLLRVFVSLGVRLTAMLPLFYVLVRHGGWEHGAAAAAGFAVVPVALVHIVSRRCTDGGS